MEQTQTHARQGFGGRSRGMPALTDIFNVAERAEAIGRYWWLLLLSGFAWIVVAATIFRFDYASVVAVATLFGILAITIGGAEFALAMMSQHWWRLLHALLGVAFVATGVIAFFTPGDTFVGLAAVISFYFIFAGTWDVISSLAMRELPGWWIQLISGLVELGLGTGPPAAGGSAPRYWSPSSAPSSSSAASPRSLSHSRSTTSGRLCHSADRAHWADVFAFCGGPAMFCH